MRFGFFVWALIMLTSSVCHGRSTLEEGILRELNLARTQPKTYAGFIRDFRKRFRGKYYTLPGSEGVRTVTTEGVAAVDEAVRYLSRKKPLRALKWTDGLAEAAGDLAEEQEETGAIGHEGKRVGGMEARIERHGNWNGTIGENIAYGPGEARLVVMQLIIDDGVKDRGHRANIFSPRFAVAGIACRPHPELRTVCVMDFARQFTGQ